MAIAVSEYELSRQQRQYIEMGIERVISNLVEDIALFSENQSWHDTSIALFGYLPPKYAYRYDNALVKQFLDTVMAVAYKYSDRRIQWRLNSVAEELAFYAILKEAEFAAGEEGYRFDLEEIMNAIYTDDDFLLLYDPTFDGVEDDDNFKNAIGLVNLSFKDWFKPFKEEFYGLKSDKGI